MITRMKSPEFTIMSLAHILSLGMPFVDVVL